MRRLLMTALVVFGVWLLGSSARAEMFKDGETVCFLGDSITAGGRYYNVISDYYLTRFPERTIRFVNAGRSGDSAGGSLKRLQEDVIEKKPASLRPVGGAARSRPRPPPVQAPLELRYEADPDYTPAPEEP